MQKAIQPLNNERGVVLVAAMLIMSALTLLGSTAVMTSTTDTKIGANYKTGVQAFYAAEAGIEEARARLRGDFTPSGSIIVDSSPGDPDWGLPSVASIQTAMTYTVSIAHHKKVIDGVKYVLYWVDSNSDGKYEISTAAPSDGHGPIYLITSESTSSNAKKKLTAMVTRRPPITVPGALYVNAPANILGNANILGVDQCGNASTNKPGIVSSLGAGTIGSSNNSVITGSTSPTGNPKSITYNSPVMDVPGMINDWKTSANYTYNVASDTQSKTKVPGPGDGWGIPTLQADLSKPSSCPANPANPSGPSLNNIVYYNTSNGTLPTFVKFTGGTSGCGILLVDGDLEINGSFSWYGVILVSGSVTYSGGGNQNVTGGIVAGGTVTAQVAADDTIGGAAHIVYCSSAVNNQTQNKPLQTLAWTENM